MKEIINNYRRLKTYIYENELVKARNVDEVVRILNIKYKDKIKIKRNKNNFQIASGLNRKDNPFRAHFKELSGRRKKRDVVKKSDLLTFSCPKCRQRYSKNLIRLRHDLWECRKCKHVFIKENVIDEFDFDNYEGTYSGHFGLDGRIKNET